MLDYPIIESDNLLLRAPSQMDLEDLYEIFSDSDTMSLLNLNPINKKQVEELIEQKIINFTNFKEIFFVIYHKSYCRTVGYICLHYREYNWQINYCINSLFRNQGFAFKALTLLLNYCKENNSKVVIACVKSTNSISIKILQKAGFKTTGLTKFYDYDNNMIIGYNYTFVF